jgi:hypothetical protein
MNNLFCNLYHWLHGQDENFVTEAFAFILRRLLQTDEALGNALVQWLCFRTDGSVFSDTQQWEVTLQETVREGRPDIWLRSAIALVLIEVKKRSGLGKDQLKRYRSILNKSGVEIRRLVLLTESPVEIGGNGENADCEMRWHKVAEWLRANQSSDPVTNFVMIQFVTFLEETTMAVQKVERDYLRGVEAFRRLVTMLEKAIQDCGIGFKRSYQRNRFGFYLVKPTDKAFLVYIDYKTPQLLLFRFAEARCDTAKFQSLGCGRLVDGNASFELNLADGNPDFFSLSADAQMEVVTDFIKGSYEKALRCIFAPA